MSFTLDDSLTEKKIAEVLRSALKELEAREEEALRRKEMNKELREDSEVKKFIPFVHHEEQTVTKQDGTQERRRLIYGVVYEPFTVDAQGDWATPETIEEAAHKFLIDSRKMKVMHRLNTDKVLPVESYIAPQDFRLGQTLIRKGSWVLVSKILDEAIWEDVENGKLQGYSLGGRSSVQNGEAPPVA